MNSLPLKVAILGAGPAGLFTLDALIRRQPDAQVDVFERLPTPFGLVRSGVAPDHQGTKAVVRQFERAFLKPNVRLLANVDVGRDISVEEIAEGYDLVFVATGPTGDRRLGLPGEDLAGVYGSLAFTGWLNGHPDQRDLSPLLGEQVVVIGAGNVALDIARLLAKSAAELAESDLCEHAGSLVGVARQIHVVGRCSLANVRFDAAELRALGALRAASVGLAPEHRSDLAALAAGPLREALSNFGDSGTRPTHIEFRFGLRPVAILGSSRVTGVRFADHAGTVLDIPCDAVITAIGAQQPDPAWPAHFRAVGWASGAAGAIPDSRRQAAACVEAALAARPESRGREHDPASRLADRRVDWTGWKAIEQTEASRAAAPRPREKLTRWADLLSAARGVS